jgi:hypothetical protein
LRQGKETSLSNDSYRDTAINRRRFVAACGAAAGGAAAGGAAAGGAAIGGNTASAQQRKPNAIHIEDPYLLVVRQTRVHRELGLTERQIEAIRAATDEVDGPLFLLRDLGVEQRSQKSAPLAKQVRDKMQQTLTRLQQQRLAQIVAQTQGHRALLRDDLAAQLRMTASQRKELLDVAEETEEEKQKLSEKVKKGGSRSDAQREVTELMTDEQKKFVATLSVTQKPQLRSIFGAAYKVVRNPLPHFKPPKLPLAGPWINSEPLTLDKLKGKVVALHFYAFA